MEPDFKFINQLASECFMPLSYGGGIHKLDHAKKIFELGVEKICINSSLFRNINLIKNISEIYGKQSIIGSIDYKKNIFGKNKVFNSSFNIKTNFDPVTWAKKVEEFGVGEVLLTSIDQEGTWNGFDVNTIKDVTKSLSIPLIANGGAGSIEDVQNLIKFSKVAAIGLGSLVVYQKKGMGVLINYPKYFL